MKRESCSYRLQSRPGQLLVDHLTNTARICSKITRKTLSLDSEGEMEFLANVAWSIGYTHDLGKATSYFQEYLIEEDNEKKASLKNRSETHHSLLSSLFTYQIVSDYTKTEGLSNHRIYGYFPILSFLVVKRHHGDLRDIKDEILSLKGNSGPLPIIKDQLDSIDPEEFDCILGKCPHVETDLDMFNRGVESLVNYTILKDEKRKWRNYCKKNSLDMYLLFQFLYSALLSADKSDAIGVRSTEERHLPSSDLVDQYRVIKFGGVKSEKKQIDVMRDQIYDEVLSSIKAINPHDRIYSINVPTGTGKTLTGLSFALKLRDKIATRDGFIPRIIYCLPFLSVIDQNFSVFEDIFQTVEGTKPDNRVLLKHHHLAEITFRSQENEELPPDESLFMVEGWESEIVVTTFMQLFHSLISNRNRMIRKFNAMINSIIILDEVQTIPYKYWNLVRKVFLRFARLFNTHFVFMTATQPLIFEEHEIKELVSKNSKKQYLERLDRIQFVNQAHDPLSMADFKIILRKDMARFSDDDFLIVLNTINCSIEVFEDIQTYLKEQNLTGVIQLYYLSTNIIPKHRLERIKFIKESNNRKIIVSTQLVEAGVDIDVDRVYRDFAPFDSLNQVAGRCNREFSPGEKGIVTVFRLKEAKEFHTYIYGKGDISVSKTKDLLRGKKELSEKDFLKLGDDYFRRLKEALSDEKSEYMIELLSRLNFSTISKKFKLIQCKYPTRDLFIEVDEEAENVWKEYRRACEVKDPFERKYKINRIKKDFYSYVISVPTKNVPGTDLEDTSITYINKEQLVSTYNESTGFIRKDPGQYIF